MKDDLGGLEFGPVCLAGTRAECAQCGGMIDVGAEILWSYNGRDWAHADCIVAADVEHRDDDRLWP